MQGKSTNLPGEICCQAEKQAGSRDTVEAAEVSRSHSTGAVEKGRAEHQERMSRMSSLRDEQGRQPTPDRGTAGQGREVKLPVTDPRAEPPPMRDEGKSNVELWEQVWALENLTTALQLVESNRGAPGTDGMTVKDLRPYLPAQCRRHREGTLVGDQGSPRKRSL